MRLYRVALAVAEAVAIATALAIVRAMQHSWKRREAVYISKIQNDGDIAEIKQISRDYHVDSGLFSCSLSTYLLQCRLKRSLFCTSNVYM